MGSVEEAQLAIRHGASALGLVFTMPSGPNIVPTRSSRRSRRRFRRGRLFSPHQRAVRHVDHRTAAPAVEVNTIRSAIGSLAAPMPACAGAAGDFAGQVVHVTGEETIEEALAVSAAVDAILLDSGNQSLAVKERRHGSLPRLADQPAHPRGVPSSAFLAGGYGPTMSRAIRVVRPFGLDLCSGVTQQQARGDQAGGVLRGGRRSRRTPNPLIR